MMNFPYSGDVSKATSMRLPAPAIMISHQALFGQLQPVRLRNLSRVHGGCTIELDQYTPGSL